MAGPDVGILALTRSPEREARYRWIFNVVTDDLVLVGLPGTEVGDLAALKDRPVGVLRVSGAEVLLREQGFTRVEPAAEEWTNAERLRERLIDAWLAPRLMVLWAWRGDAGRSGRSWRSARSSAAARSGSPARPTSSPEIAALWGGGSRSSRPTAATTRIVSRYLRLQAGACRRPADARFPWGTRG